MRKLVAILIILIVVFTGSLVFAETEQEKDILDRILNALRHGYSGEKIGEWLVTDNKLKEDKAEALVEKARKKMREQGRKFWKSLSKASIGRFQAIAINELPFVLILDTKEGHVWIWDITAYRNQQPSLQYQGQIYPVKN